MDNFTRHLLDELQLAVLWLERLDGNNKNTQEQIKRWKKILSDGQKKMMESV